MRPHVSKFVCHNFSNGWCRDWLVEGDNEGSSSEGLVLLMAQSAEADRGPRVCDLTLEVRRGSLKLEMRLDAAESCVRQTDGCLRRDIGHTSSILPMVY